MQNKKHNILDDAWVMDTNIMGGAKHSMRVGLITNTVMNAIPVVIPDVYKLVPDNYQIDFNKLEGFEPTLLNFSHGDMQVAVLLVRDKDSKHLQCYPFNNLQEGGYWWVYEVAFDLTPDGRIEVRPVHPLVNYCDPTKEMMAHLEALAVICGAYIYRVQNRQLSLVEEDVNFTKINRKRLKNKKTPIENNWVPEYVD